MFWRRLGRTVILISRKLQGGLFRCNWCFDKLNFWSHPGLDKIQLCPAQCITKGLKDQIVLFKKNRCVRAFLPDLHNACKLDIGQLTLGNIDDVIQKCLTLYCLLEVFVSGWSFMGLFQQLHQLWWQGLIVLNHKNTKFLLKPNFRNVLIWNIYWIHFDV